MFDNTKQFRDQLRKLSREDLLDIIQEQNPETIKQINRIEWVFENKLQHLAWNDGTPILGRPLTVNELSLLVEEPFEVNNELLNMRSFCRTTKANTHC
jgi:hypothetical protein